MFTAIKANGYNPKCGRSCSETKVAYFFLSSKKKLMFTFTFFSLFLRYSRVISLLNCFAGGVFLGTCLLDLFPEVQDNIDEVMVALKINSSFPFAEFLVVLGLFTVLIVEQISLDCKHEPSR